MSKLHVTQIEGFVTKELSAGVDMADSQSHGPDQRRKAFLTRALSVVGVAALVDSDPTELAANVTDGPQDGGIDHIYFDPNEKTLYLSQSKWHESGHGSIELGDLLKFLDGVRRILNNDLNGLNAKIQALRPSIERALYDANAKFNLVLSHTGQDALGKEVEAAAAQFLAEHNDASEIMTLTVLRQGDIHRLIQSGLAGKPIALEVQLQGWGQLREPQVAVYGKVSATDIAGWLEAHGPRLFESNLRQFLGSSTVNSELVRTLTTAPETFFYLNNGITAVTTDLKKKPIGGNSTESGVFECTGFSVVNGAQTVGSIHAASRIDPAAVARATVMLRVVSLEGSQKGFSLDVTRCTNTQNAIERRDFVALDPEQERIRSELHMDGVEYAYKAGDVRTASDKRFDLSEGTLARACSGPDVGLAVQAKREVGRLWDDIAKTPYKTLFNSGVSGPQIFEAVKALRSIEAALDVAQQARHGREQLICIHGNRFVEWVAFRMLGWTQDSRLEQLSHDISKVVETAVAATISAVKSHYADSYPASLFKNLTKCRHLAKVVESIQAGTPAPSALQSMLEG